jgi:hypothetical protein
MTRTSIQEFEPYQFLPPLPDCPITVVHDLDKPFDPDPRTLAVSDLPSKSFGTLLYDSLAYPLNDQLIMDVPLAFDWTTSAELLEMRDIDILRAVANVDRLTPHIFSVALRSIYNNSQLDLAFVSGRGDTENNCVELGFGFMIPGTWDFH